MLLLILLIVPALVQCSPVVPTPGPDGQIPTGNGTAPAVPFGGSLPGGASVPGGNETGPASLPGGDSPPGGNETAPSPPGGGESPPGGAPVPGGNETGSAIPPGGDSPPGGGSVPGGNDTTSSPPPPPPPSGTPGGPLGATDAGFDAPGANAGPGPGAAAGAAAAAAGGQCATEFDCICRPIPGNTNNEYDCKCGPAGGGGTPQHKPSTPQFDVVTTPSGNAVEEQTTTTPEPPVTPEQFSTPLPGEPTPGPTEPVEEGTTPHDINPGHQSTVICAKPAAIGVNPEWKQLFDDNGRAVNVDGTWAEYSCAFGLIEPLQVTEKAYLDILAQCNKTGFDVAQLHSNFGWFPFQVGNTIQEHYRERKTPVKNIYTRTAAQDPSACTSLQLTSPANVPEVPGGNETATEPSLPGGNETATEPTPGGSEPNVTAGVPAVTVTNLVIPSSNDSTVPAATGTPPPNLLPPTTPHDINPEHVATVICTKKPATGAKPDELQLFDEAGQQLQVRGTWVEYECPYGVIEPLVVTPAVYADVLAQCTKAGFEFAQLHSNNGWFPFQVDQQVEAYYSERRAPTKFYYTRRPAQNPATCTNIALTTPPSEPEGAETSTPPAGPGAAETSTPHAGPGAAGTSTPHAGPEAPELTTPINGPEELEPSTPASNPPVKKL